MRQCSGMSPEGRKPLLVLVSGVNHVGYQFDLR